MSQYLSDRYEEMLGNGATAAGSVAQAMLFGLKSTEPLTLALAIGSLTIVAVAASLLPAMRATAIHPTQVLRVGMRRSITNHLTKALLEKGNHARI